MRSPMTQEERYIKMTETPISRLIPSLAIPTIISMLVTSIYNMADTFFVSRISTSASAAVGVSYSLMAMIQALGFTLGMGSGNYLSRVLGSRDEEKAERIASTGFYTAIFVGLVFAAICLPLRLPLSIFKGAHFKMHAAFFQQPDCPLILFLIECEAGSFTARPACSTSAVNIEIQFIREAQ